MAKIVKSPKVGFTHVDPQIGWNTLEAASINHSLRNKNLYINNNNFTFHSGKIIIYTIKLFTFNNNIMYTSYYE